MEMSTSSNNQHHQPESAGCSIPNPSSSTDCHLDKQQPAPDPQSDAPLPRPKRRARRAKADRGLPPDEELAKLGPRLPGPAAQALARDGPGGPVARADRRCHPPDGRGLQGAASHRQGRCGSRPAYFAKFCSEAGRKLRPLLAATTAARCRSSTRWSTPWTRPGPRTGSSPGPTCSATTRSPGLTPARQGYSSYKAILRRRGPPDRDDLHRRLHPGQPGRTGVVEAGCAVEAAREADDRRLGWLRCQQPRLGREDHASTAWSPGCSSRGSAKRSVVG